MTHDTQTAQFVTGAAGLLFGLGALMLALGLLCKLAEWWQARSKPPLVDGESIASRLGKLHW